MTKQPDIVMVVLDTQRSDRLSCYGYPTEISPHIDALAADSTRFEYAVAPAQWTVPTHASIFTGLYPSQHNAQQMDSVLAPEVPTLAERLGQAGYYTAGFSHNPLVGVVENGLRRGFRTFSNYDHLGAGLLTASLSTPSNKKDSFAKLRRTMRFVLAEFLGYSQRSSAHRVSPMLLPLWRSFLHLRGGAKQEKSRRSLAELANLLIARPGLSSAQPIFAFLNLMGTHVPYDPPRWAIDRFLSEKLGSRPGARFLQHANTLQVDVSNWLAMQLPDAEYKAVLDAYYDAEVAAQDLQVGGFIQQLESAGKLDDTFLIIVADHGDHLGEKGRVNHVFGVYQELTHVPLLIRDPSGALGKGTVLNPFVSTRRLFHTALSVARAATAEEESLSLAHVSDSDGKRDLEHGTAFSEAAPLEWAIQRVEKVRPGLVAELGYDMAATAIHSDSYKLISTGTQDTCLFDVRADQTESLNLRGQMPEQVELMKSRLQEWRWKMLPVADAVSRGEDDPVILEHLRVLGYLDPD